MLLGIFWASDSKKHATEGVLYGRHLRRPAVGLKGKANGGLCERAAWRSWQAETASTSAAEGRGGTFGNTFAIWERETGISVASEGERANLGWSAAWRRG